MKPSPEQITAEYEALKREERELERVREILNRRDAELANALDRIELLETQQRESADSLVIAGRVVERLTSERDEAISLLRGWCKTIENTKSLQSDKTMMYIAAADFLARLEGKDGQ